MVNNKGLIIGRRETDYILGSSSIEKKIQMPDGDWKELTPEHEIQNIPIETLMCVTFSATDAIEYQFTYFLNNNLLQAEDVKWLKDKGYFKNGFINFNERFTATLGETTRQGAYQYKVGDAIRKFGLIPQDMFPLVDNFDDNVDKSKITKEMYDLGSEFIKRFPVSYEWALDINEGLKYAPLQVCVYYADGDGILCPNQNPQHAVVAVNSKIDYIEIDDSYKRQFKKYCPQAVYSAMLYTIKFKEKNMNLKKEKNDKNIYLVNENKKTKTMIVDFPSFEVFDDKYEEVDSLTEYTNNGTMVWVNRIID